MRKKHSPLFACTAILATGFATGPGADVFGPGVISTEQYESHPAISPDGGLLLFVKSDPDFSRWTIWESHRTSSGWSNPARATFAKADIAADPFFAPDGKRVYFISTRLAPGETKRNLDIWMVERRGLRWGAPQRLPEPINSSAAEWFPRLQPDGTLYFGSDRKGGLGRTDIYRARNTKAGWTVENLGAPVNSAGDEYEFEIAPNGKTAVLMRAADASSQGDLYRVRRIRQGWARPRKFGPEINTDALEVGPLFSRDSCDLYFSSRRSDERLGDIYRIRICAAK